MDKILQYMPTVVYVKTHLWRILQTDVGCLIRERIPLKLVQSLHVPHISFRLNGINGYILIGIAWMLFAIAVGPSIYAQEIFLYYVYLEGVRALVMALTSLIIALMYWRLCGEVRALVQRQTFKTRITFQKIAFRLLRQAFERHEWKLFGVWGLTWVLGAGIGTFNIWLWWRGAWYLRSLMGIGLLGWMMAWGYGAWPIVREFFQREALLFSCKGLRVMKCVLFWRQMTQYPLSAIPEIHAMENTVAFHLHGKTVYCGRHLTQEHAIELANQLTAIVNAQQIVQVVFGDSTKPDSQDAVTLFNPNMVSVKMPPLYRLQWLVLHTPTYDLCLVEVFLTHVLNTLGIQYVKNNLNVAIYGSIDRLHPNLLKNIRTFCHHIYVNGNLESVTYVPVRTKKGF